MDDYIATNVRRLYVQPIDVINDGSRLYQKLEIIILPENLL